MASCPHARGGVPLAANTLVRMSYVVPMLVGVFRREKVQMPGERPVVPMLVGVFRLPMATKKHAIAVVPMLVGVFLSTIGFAPLNAALSPCSWGCSAQTN